MSRGSKQSFASGVIANGTALSGEIATGGLDVVGILIPTITSAAITLQASHDGVTFFDVWNLTAEVSFAASTGGRWLTSEDLPRGVQVLKVRSGTAGAPVNQGADRTIVVALREQ